MKDTAKLIIGIVVGAFVLLALFVLFTAGGAGSMGGGVMGGFGLLFMGLFLGLIVALVVGLVVWISNQGRR